MSAMTNDWRDRACVVASYPGIPGADEDLSAYVRKVAAMTEELLAIGDTHPDMREFLIDAFLGLGYDPVVVAEAFYVPLNHLGRIRESVQ